MIELNLSKLSEMNFTVNHYYMLIGAYAVVHFMFGFILHRVALKDYLATNEKHKNSDKYTQIKVLDISALFVHRMLFGLPHRILLFAVSIPIVLCCWLLNLIAVLACGTNPKIKFPLRRTLSYLDPAETGDVGPFAIAWTIITICGIGLDIYWGWTGFTVLTILYCLLAIPFSATTDCQKDKFFEAMKEAAE